MPSGITASRLALGAALEAAGLRVGYDPYSVAPPAVLVIATDPWVQASHLTVVSRALRWRTVAVAGRADAAVTLEALESLVAAIATAPLPEGFSAPEFDAPGTVDLGGAQYLAAVGRVDHLTEV